MVFKIEIIEGVSRFYFYICTHTYIVNIEGIIVTRSERVFAHILSLSLSQDFSYFIHIHCLLGATSLGEGDLAELT